jgi:hypothetical protein
MDVLQLQFPDWLQDPMRRMENKTSWLAAAIALVG